MTTDSQLDRSTDDPGESAAIDLEEFWERAYAEARVRRFRRWARFEASVFLLAALSPIIFWVWDSFYRLINSGARVAAGEIAFAVVFHVVLAAFPIMSVILVCRCRSEQVTTIPIALIYGRYFAWVWSPILLVIVLGVFDSQQITWKHRHLTDHAMRHWHIAIPLFHIFWNTYVVLTLRGTSGRWLIRTAFLFWGNFVLFLHCAVAYFFLGLAGL